MRNQFTETGNGFRLAVEGKGNVLLFLNCLCETSLEKPETVSVWLLKAKGMCCLLKWAAMVKEVSVLAGEDGNMLLTEEGNDDESGFEKEQLGDNGGGMHGKTWVTWFIIQRPVHLGIHASAKEKSAN